METNTPRNFALQLGALVSLYVTLSSLLVLLFGLVDLTFKDALDTIYAYDSAQSSVRFSIAVLFVFFPAYVVLTRLVNTIRRKEQGKYLVLTKWLIYLSLVVGGGVLLGDLVAVMNAFLNGEITERFVAKAFSVFAVVGAAFYYYIQDARGHWTTHEKHSVFFAGVAATIVIIVLIFGFLTIDTPAMVRDVRLDVQQVSDLQDIQWRIEDYIRTNKTLPNDLEDLYTLDVPTAPEGRAAYEYAPTENGFSLCATFGAETSELARTYPVVPEKDVLIGNAYDWDHTAGRFCFDRTVTIE